MRAIKKPENPKGITKSIEKFVKTFKEFEEFVNKYRTFYDIYTGISTVRRLNGQLSGAKSYQYHRHVLFLDFDKKDYPDLETAEDFTGLIKSKTDLYIHACVESGHGYHFYTAIKRESDINLATKVNKELAQLVGADLKACLPTQIARVPTSYNHKMPDGTLNYKEDGRKDWSLVKIVYNNINHETVFRPHLDTVRQKVESDLQALSIDQKNTERNAERQAATNPLSLNWADCKNFYCVQKVRQQGTYKGRRNFWLGRIVNLHKLRGNDYNFAQNDVLKWNELCNPPKNKKEILRDFEAYWRGNYRLLGCVDSLHDKADIETLEEVCDPAMCLCNRDTNLAITNGGGIKMPNAVLAKKTNEKTHRVSNTR